MLLRLDTIGQKLFRREIASEFIAQKKDSALLLNMIRREAVEMYP